MDSNRFGTMFDDLDKGASERTSRRLFDAPSPDTAVSALNTAPSTGLDPDALMQDPAALQQIQRSDYDTKALSGRPDLRNFVNQSTTNAALAQDELPELGFFENAQKWLADSSKELFGWNRRDDLQNLTSRSLEGATKIGTGVFQTVRGVSASSRAVEAVETLNTMRLIMDGGQPTADQLNARGFLTSGLMFDEDTGSMVSFLNASDEQRQTLIGDMTKAFGDSDEEVREAALMVALMAAENPQGPELSVDNIPEIIAFYGIQSTALALPALVAGVAGGRQLGLMALGGQGLTTGYSEAVKGDILEDGPDAFYSRDTHTKGLIVAPLFAATEFLGPVGRVLRRPFADISEDLMIQALRARSLPAQAGTVLLGGALEEGMAEMMQDMLVDWGNGELEWTEDGIKKYLTSAAVGALVGGPMTATLEVPALAAQARRNEQAQRDGVSNGVLQQIQDQAGNIKMRERSPEKWREFLQSIGTDSGRMYVEPSTLQDAVAAGTVDLETLGVTQEALDTAIEAGGRVQVKQTDWAANYAGKETGQTLLENSSTQANGYTPAQLRNFQDLVAEANAESKFNAEQIKELDQRTSDLRTERRLAMKREGMSNAEASANATLQSAAVRTLAQRTGDMGVFDQFQLNIEGTTALGQRQAADVVSRRYDQAPPKIRGSQPANSGNKHGLMPHLRSTTAPPPADRVKAVVLAKTNNANADRQLQGVDEVQSRHPDPAASAGAWNAMMGDALASADVPAPPYKFLSDINSGGAVEMLKTLSDGQIEDADHGFDNAREFREAYTSGEVTIAETGKLFLWSFLSRGVSPYTQESLFLDAFDGIATFIEQAAAGELDLDAYYAWAATTAPKGSGQSGSGAIHNLNAFGRDFLTRMSQDSGDGRSRLQVLHDMMGDPEATGQQVRREFARIGESVGIDNKVVSFTLLVAGFTDVMVLDRVQIRNLWNDGRFDGINLYDGYKVDGKAVTGSGLASLTNGVRGLMIYEAIEQSLSARIDAIYTEVGRPDAASIGRYHWETWVAASQQEASHGTIDAILRQIKGDQQPLGGVTAKEGEYGSYAYGARYGIDADGQSYFLYEVPSASPDQPPLGLYKFDVASFNQFLTEIKKPKAGVVPRGRFRVTEAGNEPWYFQEGVSLDALSTVAGDFGTAVDPEQVRPVDVKNGIDQNVTDRPAADQSGATRSFDQGGIERGIQEPEERYSGGGEAGRQLPALEGAPTVRGTSGPDPRLVAVAEKYAADNGIWLERQDEFVEVDAERATRIADAYEKMKHDPQDPVVAEAYQNMIDQTVAQYNALIADGYEFYFIDLNSPEGQEYASSPFNAMFELRNDKRMGVFATDEGFGSDQAFDPADNPMLADTGFQWTMGPDGTPQPVYANDLFRAVHDAFGHGLEFAGFRARGEENAWQAHVRLFTGSAVAAITTETRGQNSWLNYGPHGENNRTAKVEDTIFADQKTGLMPEFTWSEGKAGPRTFDQSAPKDYDPSTITIAETGEPLRVYHGTINDFDEFSDGMIFMSSRRGLAVEHAMRAPKAAGRTPRVIEATVALENPLIVGPVDTDTDVYWLQNSMSLERQMRDFDGLLVYNNDGEVLVIAKRNDQVTQQQQPPTQQRTLDQTLEGALGRITLPDNVKTGESLIQLFEQANPSTMAHEFGHYLIEVMRVIGEGDGAPQSIVDDLATVNAWMEEVTGEPVNGPYTTAQQEAWAEAWENYLMSGKAPSPSLKTVFRKFALWMAEVYKTAVGAGTQPSPEIRGVMDRLLATDQEIAVTQMENADLDLFTEKPPYMTQGEWDTYKRVAERGDAEAQGKLLNVAMESERKKQSKEWKAEYKRALVQAREDLAEQREYVLIAALGDKDNDFGLGARLDRDTLIDMFGKAILDDLKALKAKQLIYVKDGADPDQVADMFGYRNGADMVQTLRTVRPLEEQAQANARQEANKLAPPLKEAEMRENAEAALKNPTRTERVSREAATLVKASGGVASSWTVMNRAAKERATQLVGEMNVQQAGNYRQFAVAARKAAREAQAQLAKVVRLADGTPNAGGMEAMRKAADAKRQQLLNDHMYTVARERAKTFDKARVKFKKAQTKKQREKVDPAYMDQVDALLEQYDFVQRTKAELVTMKRERKALAQFQMDIDEAGMGSELSISPTVLARAGAGKVNYNELTVDQMEMVVDTIENLIHAGKGVKKSYLENETLMYGEMVNEITLEMARSMKGTPRPDRESGQRSGLPKFLGALNQNIETALTTIRRMDGWKDNGPAMRYIFRPLQRAAAAVEERREQETVRLKEVYSKHYSKKEIRALNDKRKHGIYVPELGATFSKAGLLSIALNSGNAGNFQRLTDVEGVQGDGAYDATRVNAALKARLTEKDWRFVQDMWDHIDGFWPEISKLEREVTGVVPAKVQAVLQVDAPDFVKGGYYPIQYDRDLNIASFLNGSDDAYKDATGGRHGKAQTRHGHTEERLNSTGMALDLNLGVAENHIMKITHDLAMRKPINHAVKVLNNPLIGQTLNQFGRPSDLDALRSWLVDTAAGDSISADSMGAVMRYARKALTVKYIGFSLATLILQPFGAIQAGVVVGNRDLASGYTKYMGRASYWNNFIQTNSAHMRLRVRAVNREVNEFAREARTAETAASGPLNRWTNLITSMSLAPIGQIQYWTVDIPVFIAAFEKARGEGKSEADAVSLAENAVDRASGSGSFLNRASFERGTSSNSARRTEYIKTFTMLASYVHSKYNAAVEAKGRTDFNSPMETLLFTGSMIQLFAIEAALVTAYRAIGDERDDDEPTGKWLASIVGSEVLGLHPVTRPVSSYVSGYGTGSVPLSDFADLLAKGASGTIDIASGEGDLNDALAAFDAGATPFMLPTGQMKKIIRALVADDPSTQLGRVALGLAPERE